MANIIQLNQAEIKSQLGDLVRQSVEDTLMKVSNNMENGRKGVVL